MSVQKSYRFSDFTYAILEELVERTGKKQTEILEELIQGHVIWDYDSGKGMEIIKAAEIRLATMKSKKHESNETE